MKEKRLKGHREEKVILNSRVRKGLAEQPLPEWTLRRGGAVLTALWGKSTADRRNSQQRAYGKSMPDMSEGQHRTPRARS